MCAYDSVALFVRLRKASWADGAGKISSTAGAVLDWVGGEGERQREAKGGEGWAIGGVCYQTCRCLIVAMTMLDVKSRDIRRRARTRSSSVTPKGFIAGSGRDLSGRFSLLFGRKAELFSGHDGVPQPQSSVS